jgi:long-chain fatty acid transport protein
MLVHNHAANNIESRTIMLRPVMLGGHFSIGMLIAVASLSDAHAGAFLIRDQSAAGFGMALAGVSAGTRLSYSFWNPAVLGNVRDFQLEGVATAILPSIDIEPNAATNALIGAIGGTPSDEVDVGRNAVVPALFAAIPVNDQITAGIAVTSPFGLATRAPENWAGQVYSRSSEIRSYNVNPMAAYRINDLLTVGAGVQFQYFRAELSQAAGFTPGAPSASLDADDTLGIGFNLGLQLHPLEGTSIGLGYRSSIAQDLKGTLSTPLGDVTAGGTLDTPDVLSLGVSQAITPSLRVLGTIEWDNWSRLGTVPIEAANGAALTSLQLDYRDGWLYAMGVEYDVNSKLTVRAGLGYEVAPLTAENRDTRFPEVDQVLGSAGLSYRYSDRVSVDVSYLYSHGLGDGEISLAADNPRFVGVPFEGTSNLGISIVSAALNLTFGP